MGRFFPKRHLKLIALGFGLFLFFLYIRFPITLIKGRIESELTRVFPDTIVTIGGLSPSLLPGANLKDVTFESAVLPAGDPNGKFKVSKVKFRFALLPLLLMRTKVSVTIVDKEISLALSLSEGLWKRDYLGVDLKIKQLSLTKLFTPGYLNTMTIGKWKQSMANPQLAAFMNVAAKGQLEGAFSLSGKKSSFYAADFSATKASWDFSGSKIAIEGLVPGTLDLGKMVLSGALQKGDLKFDKFGFTGNDLVADIGGNVKLEKPPQLGNMNLEVKLTIPPSGSNNLAGTLNIMLMPMGIEVKDRKAAFKVLGPLGGQPRILPL